MHLKIHPEGVEFLRQFGLMFLFVFLMAAGYFMRMKRADRLWSHSDEDSEPQEETKEDK